jgi:hypothetical protein
LIRKKERMINSHGRIRRVNRNRMLKKLLRMIILSEDLSLRNRLKKTFKLIKRIKYLRRNIQKPKKSYKISLMTKKMVKKMLFRTGNRKKK